MDLYSFNVVTINSGWIVNSISHSYITILSQEELGVYVSHLGIIMSSIIRLFSKYTSSSERCLEVSIDM